MPEKWRDEDIIKALRCEAALITDECMSRKNCDECPYKLTSRDNIDFSELYLAAAERLENMRERVRQLIAR